jgi:hypothetical protein
MQVGVRGRRNAIELWTSTSSYRISKFVNLDPETHYPRRPTITG